MNERMKIALLMMKNLDSMCLMKILLLHLKNSPWILNMKEMMCMLMKDNMNPLSDCSLKMMKLNNIKKENLKMNMLYRLSWKKV